ncbi:MAG: hypothetical protein QGF67_12360 [Lentisphaeria bacterium]|nr:hypothetical protein [Lentisphaeria bacterium]
MDRRVRHQYRHQRVLVIELVAATHDERHRDQDNPHDKAPAQLRNDQQEREQHEVIHENQQQRRGRDGDHADFIGADLRQPAQEQQRPLQQPAGRRRQPAEEQHRERQLDDAQEDDQPGDRTDRHVGRDAGRQKQVVVKRRKPEPAEPGGGHADEGLQQGDAGAVPDVIRIMRPNRYPVTALEQVVDNKLAAAPTPDERQHDDEGKLVARVVQVKRVQHEHCDGGKKNEVRGDHRKLEAASGRPHGQHDPGAHRRWRGAGRDDVEEEQHRRQEVLDRKRYAKEAQQQHQDREQDADV